MKIVSERVGDNVVVTVDGSDREVALILPVETARELGVTLLMQATLSSDVTVPDAWTTELET